MALFLFVALLFAGPGLIPGRVLIPADMPRDLLAWKHDPAVRVRVSNSLLSDVSLQLIPWDEAARRHLVRGEMPWSNELAGRGEAIYANPLAGVLSPFTWPRYVSILGGWAWSLLLKLVVAMGGMFWLARVCGADRRAATISAIVFAASGYSIVWGLYPHTNAFVLLPALGASAVVLAGDLRPRNALIAAVLAMLATFAGHPETLLVGVTSLFVFLIANKTRIRETAASWLAGFVMCGIQLVPFFLILAGSHAVAARADILALRLRRYSLVSLLLPGYLGSPLAGELDLTGLRPNVENFNQRNGAYIGALVLLALIFAFRKLPRTFQRAATVGGGALLLSWSVPGIAHLLRMIPIVSWVAPEYWAVGWVLLASLAAGPAVIALQLRRSAVVLLLIAGTALLLAGMLPTVAPSLLQSTARRGIAYLQARGSLPHPAAVYEARIAQYLVAAKWTALRRLALPGFCWIVFAIFHRASSRWRSLAITAALTELVFFGLGYLPSIRVDEVAPSPAAVNEIRARDPENRFFMTSSNDVFAPNLATSYGVRDVHAYDILTPESYVKELAAAGLDPMTNSFPPALTPDQERVLAQHGVRFFITAAGVRELAGAVPQAMPRNEPPRGFGVGAVVSVAGLVLLGSCCWVLRTRSAAAAAQRP